MSRERAYLVCAVLRLLIIAAVSFVIVRGCIGALHDARTSLRAVQVQQQHRVDQILAAAPMERRP